MAYRINKDIINRNKINKDGINKVSIIKTAFKIFTAATMLLLFLPPSRVGRYGGHAPNGIFHGTNFRHRRILRITALGQ